jgi:hypothetical protein
VVLVLTIVPLMPRPCKTIHVYMYAVWIVLISWAYIVGPIGVTCSTQTHTTLFLAATLKHVLLMAGVTCNPTPAYETLDLLISSPFQELLPKSLVRWRRTSLRINSMMPSVTARGDSGSEQWATPPGQIKWTLVAASTTTTMVSV